MGCSHYAILNVIGSDGKLESDIALTSVYFGDGQMRCTSCGVVLKEEEFKKDYNTRVELDKIREKSYKAVQSFMKRKRR